jgi:hypothetical protein
VLKTSATKLRWLLASLGLGVVYLGVGIAGPPTVGIWQDDSTYLITAQALAEGSGYRHVETPGEPLQTKYPILFPALLAGVFFFFPDYPGNLWLLLAPGALLAGAFVVLSALYLRRVLDEPSPWIAVAVGLAALSPEIFSLVRFAMSDLPYACLAVAALLCLDLSDDPEASSRRHRGLLAAGGVLIGAAVLTRSFGLTLALAALATLLLRRRAVDAALLGAVVVGMALPWWLWQAAATTANGAMQTSPTDAYDLSYGLWLPSSPAELWRAVHQNFFRTIYGLSYYQLSLPSGWVQGAIRATSGKIVLIHAVCYATVALLGVGFLTSARRSLRTLHVYALFYGGAILVWPFDPYRFLVGWTPFLIYFLISGLRFMTASLGSSNRPAWLSKAPAVALCVVLFVWFVQEDALILGSSPERIYVLRKQVDRSGHDEVTEWLRAHTRPGDIVATNDTADFYLAVGRQVRDTAPGIDPFSLLYGSDRRFANFYTISTAPHVQREILEDVYPNLEKMLVSDGIDYYVQHGVGGMAEPMERFMKEKPHWFQHAFTTEGGDYRVYRVAGSVR